MGEVLRVIHQRVDDYFEITDRGSTVPTEIRGGLVSFLTMSYILLVNPNILTAWIDYDPDHLKEDYGKDIATATAITCGLGSILVGVLARMPFAIGPGMGLNTFVAALYSAATSKGDLADAKNTFGVVSATTFVAGVILLVISAANLVSPAVNAMPMTMKTAIMVGIGAFQAFVGMREMGIVVSDSTNLVNLEEFPSFIWQHRGEYNSGYAQLLFVIGLLLTTVLFMKRVKGSILLGIFLVTALSWAMNIGGGKLPVPPVGVPELSHTWATVDFAGWVRNAKKFAPQTFVILLITIFDCGGVLFGIGQLLNLPAKYAAAAEKKRESARVINGSIEQHGTGEDRHAEILPG
ncbi:Guanine/hypoxanthine permease PbuG, partial [Diplonema papillatum]